MIDKEKVLEISKDLHQRCSDLCCGISYCFTIVHVTVNGHLKLK